MTAPSPSLPVPRSRSLVAVAVVIADQVAKALVRSEIKPGERVVMAYGSANFDEDIFDDPFTFDITRENNAHVTFGGNGPHYCPGANLAKLQIELIFNAIANHLPDIASLGDRKRLRSGWLNGITEWPVSFCPAAKAN